MKRMLATFREAMARRGLTLHPSKCKVQTNSKNPYTYGQMQIQEDFSVEVLPPGANLVVLGTVLNLEDVTEKEITNRIASAWRLFWSMKPILLNRRVSVKRRLRLFDATVSSCVTWCCESWAPIKEELQRLEVARRSMLRKIVCTGRGPAEEWISWIRRATHKALDLASQTGVRKWTTFHGSKKWRWAGHVARRGVDTWLYKVTTWRDSTWQKHAMDMGGARELRPAGRPSTRWEDPVRTYCARHDLQNWTDLAANREQWEAHAESFADF